MRNQPDALNTGTPGHLSHREIEVLRLVTQGKTNREIAEELVISERTVINHLSHIFIKTGAENLPARPPTPYATASLDRRPVVKNYYRKVFGEPEDRLRPSEK